MSAVSWTAAARPEWQRYAVKTSDGESLPEEIFRLAVSENWVLSELRKEKASLEEVFASLTSGERE